MRRTFKSIMAEYGPIALGVYLTIFALVLTVSWMAIRLGWTPETAVGSVGTFTAAYLVTKVTQPLRIGATLLLTPIVARVLERFFPALRPTVPAADTGDLPPTMPQPPAR